MSVITITLYALSLVSLPAFTGFVLVRDWRSPANRHFAYLCLSLLGWVATLFAFLLPPPLPPDGLLWGGRLTFASVALALTAGYLFVREVARAVYFASWVLWAEAWARRAGLPADALGRPD